MIRRVTFTDAETLAFKLLYEAYRSRGGARPEAPVDRRSESRIIRGLKAISDPVGEPPAAGEFDGRARVLKPGGGVLELEQPDFTRLVGFFASHPWLSAASDVIEDVEHWLDAADKVEPATPVAS